MDMTVKKQSSSTGIIRRVNIARENPPPFVTGLVSYSSGLSCGVPADDLTPFERERAAFFGKFTELMATHSGKYVAISDGRVAEVGASENETARRFFLEHPDAAVYIRFVGEQPPAHQSKSAFRR